MEGRGGEAGWGFSLDVWMRTICVHALTIRLTSQGAGQRKRGCCYYQVADTSRKKLPSVTADAFNCVCVFACLWKFYKLQRWHLAGDQTERHLGVTLPPSESFAYKDAQTSCLRKAPDAADQPVKSASCFHFDKIYPPSKCVFVQAFMRFGHRLKISVEMITVCVCVCVFGGSWNGGPTEKRTAVLTEVKAMC